MTAVFVVAGMAAHAQSTSPVRLNLYTNYVFDDAVDSYYSSTAYYNGTVNGGFQWGIGLEYMIRPTQGIEIVYLRQDTKAPTTYYDYTAIADPVKSAEFDLGISYIFLGSTRYIPRSEKVELFLGGQLGLAIVHISNPTSGNEGSNSKFAWGLKGGTNIWLNQSAGLKLQAGLQSISQAVGGGLYFGTGGVGAGATSYSTVYQFSLGGGLVFRFGGK